VPPKERRQVATVQLCRGIPRWFSAWEQTKPAAAACVASGSASLKIPIPRRLGGSYQAYPKTKKVQSNLIAKRARHLALLMGKNPTHSHPNPKQICFFLLHPTPFQIKLSPTQPNPPCLGLPWSYSRGIAMDNYKIIIKIKKWCFFYLLDPLG